MMPDGVAPPDQNDDTDLALNLLAGMRGPAWSQADWFVEGRYVATGNDQLLLMFGLGFRLAAPEGVD